MTSEEKNALVETYANKLRHLIPLASKAYGSRAQTSPEHNASREYTRLLVEFDEKGGSLLVLSKTLGVAYSGLRRRVVTAGLEPRTPGKSKKTIATTEPQESLIEKVVLAKSRGSEEYHAALHRAYSCGVSLSTIAKHLGLANTYPLYYGVQRHELRSKNT